MRFSTSTPSFSISTRSSARWTSRHRCISCVGGPSEQRLHCTTLSPGLLSPHKMSLENTWENIAALLLTQPCNFDCAHSEYLVIYAVQKIILFAPKYSVLTFASEFHSFGCGFVHKQHPNPRLQILIHFSLAYSHKYRSCTNNRSYDIIH